jgi:hypothetical protein
LALNAALACVSLCSLQVITIGVQRGLVMGKYDLVKLASAAAIALPLIGCVNSTMKPAADSDVNVGAIPAASIQKSQSVAALVGSDLGLGGGYLIGADPAKIDSHDKTQAVKAARHAEQTPASLDEARSATNADLNHDGFVTLDEVMAMKRAGLSEQEILDRLRRTGYTFQLSPEQERYLTDRGVSGAIIAGIRQLGTSATGVARK